VVDNSAPVSNAVIEGEKLDTNTYYAPVSITINAQDNSSGSGFAAIKFSLDNGAWVDYTNSIVLAQLGEHSIRYYSVDSLGNQEPEQVLTLKIGEESTPTASIAAPSNNVYMKGTVTITGTAAIGLGVLDNFKLQYGTGLNPDSWITIATGTSEIVNGDIAYWDTRNVSDGVYSLRLVVTGSKGKSATQIISVTVDNTGPQNAQVKINGGGAYINSRNVSLDLSATDVSGISQMVLSGSTSFPVESWQGYQTYLSWLLSDGDGEKTIYAKFRDRLGNESTAAVGSIILDTRSPSITRQTISNGALVNLSKPTIGADFTDLVSGVDKVSGVNVSSIKITLDGIDVTSKATVTTSSVRYTPSSGPSTGTHTVKIELKDNAGNLTTKTWTFTVTRPVLATTKTKAYWAPVLDAKTATEAYTKGYLSVDYQIKNTGTGTANNVKVQNIKATTSTGTITVLSPQPIAVGSIAPGESKTITIIFKLPLNTSKYSTSFSVTCEDDGGAAF
jgi:hypothetical protein